MTLININEFSRNGNRITVKTQGSYISAGISGSSNITGVDNDSKVRIGMTKKPGSSLITASPISDWTTAANIDQINGSASQAEPRFGGVPLGSTPMYFILASAAAWEWKLSESVLSAPYMVVDIYYDELDTGYIFCRALTWTANLYGDPLYPGSATMAQYAKNVTSDLTCIDGVISGTVVLKAVTVPADGDLTLVFG